MAMTMRVRTTHSENDDHADDDDDDGDDGDDGDGDDGVANDDGHPFRMGFCVFPCHQAIPSEKPRC